MGYRIRTTLLLGLLTAILLAIGFYFGGTYGAVLALVLAFAINFASYWYSDKIVLKIYRAKPLDNKKINSMVEELAKKAGIPKPETYMLLTDVPNAFATGRNPKHSAVAVTHGLLKHLNDREIKGVLAHEISHIKNRDTLIQTLAATIGGAISWLAYLFYFGDSRNQSAVSLILLFILAPLAAALVRMAISRNREYLADKTGAILSEPEGLASALGKISQFSKHHTIRGNNATAHMFIVNPFTKGSLINLFSTHPSTESRIERLRAMRCPM